MRELRPKIDVLFVAAKREHGAEYEGADEAKATLKVRSIWRDARAAGGYGHLIRNSSFLPSRASTSFLAWFDRLFLT
jgi:hypothetical protein